LADRWAKTWFRGLLPKTRLELLVCANCRLLVVWGAGLSFATRFVARFRLSVPDAVVGCRFPKLGGTKRCGGRNVCLGSILVDAGSWAPLPFWTWAALNVGRLKDRTGAE